MGITGWGRDQWRAWLRVCDAVLPPLSLAPSLSRVERQRAFLGAPLNGHRLTAQTAQKPRPETLPPLGVLAAAQVMADGADEHGDRWLQRDARHHVGAALRHIYRWLSGQNTDPDSGRSHLAHAATRLLMATELDRQETR
jgi:hypothetical protein